MTDHNFQLNPAAQSTGPRAPGMRIEGTANTPFPTYRLSSASSYADLQYLFGVQDLAMITQKTARNRRKSAQGPDHVKHRRTRSGCFTCRSRRVKVSIPITSLKRLLMIYSAMKVDQSVKVRNKKVFTV
jgi:hypothetical protein